MLSHILVCLCMSLKKGFITYSTGVFNIRNAGLSNVFVSDGVEQTSLNMTIDERSFSSMKCCGQCMHTHCG